MSDKFDNQVNKVSFSALFRSKDFWWNFGLKKRENAVFLEAFWLMEVSKVFLKIIVINIYKLKP